jgi:NAD(P)-dependent dehydrogenase (short-subunit alcohol dehydrogenase family)
MQFGVDHLGQFALTALLMPALLRSPDARVVWSRAPAGHFGPPVDPDDPHMQHRYSPWRAYGQAKLANVHFALELQRRLEEAGVSAGSIVVHPSFTNTDLQARSARESGRLDVKPQAAGGADGGPSSSSPM